MEHIVVAITRKVVLTFPSTVSRLSILFYDQQDNKAKIM